MPTTKDRDIASLLPLA
ncbi:hypothetical protein [Rhodanobacter terrae]|uniref:Uncharacterized protein n=1 Tax=Rhodanobacter terrae TaxID=418647 RepID=A0ABW0T4J8_9GAMM